MLHKLRFVIAGLVIILVNQVVTFAVAARVPQSLRPSGTTRYAMAQTTTTADNTSSGNWIPTGLATSVTVPAGKKADVMVVFCSVGDGDGNVISVRAKIGGAVLLPSPGVTLMSVSFTGSHCATFYKTGVGEGTKIVRAEWRSFAAGANLLERSMIVTLNTY